MQADPTTDATATQVPLDPAGRIARDIPCIHCGYNLRSLLPDQTCPECGAAVEPSLRGDALRHANPRWLRRLTVGMTCIVIGQIAFVALLTGGLRWLDFWLSSILEIPRPGPRVIVYLLVSGLPVFGVWLVTSAEPARLGSSREPWTRLGARLLALAGLLLMLAVAVSPVGTAARPATAADLLRMHVLHLLYLLISTAAWVAFCLHIRPLGPRAGWPRLGRTTLLTCAGILLLGLICSAIRAWYVTHMQLWLAGTSTLEPTLRLVDRIAMSVREALVLLLVALYLLALRRQAGLARHAPMRKPLGDTAT
jgi:hypothetical protein